MNSKEKKTGNEKKSTERYLEKLKKKITSQPVLFYPEEKENLKVETNTLGHAIRGVVS